MSAKFHKISPPGFTLNRTQSFVMLASSLVSTGRSVVFVSGVSANSSVTPMKVAGARGDVQVADSFPGR